MQAGDVLVKGGAPGHAMLVMDMAEDGQGHRIYLLAQSYMPAQDIHIVRNPADAALSPWYREDAGQTNRAAAERNLNRAAGGGQTGRVGRDNFDYFDDIGQKRGDLRA